MTPSDVKEAIEVTVRSRLVVFEGKLATEDMRAQAQSMATQVLRTMKSDPHDGWVFEGWRCNVEQVGPSEWRVNACHATPIQPEQLIQPIGRKRLAASLDRIAARIDHGSNKAQTWQDDLTGAEIARGMLRSEAARLRSEQARVDLLAQWPSGITPPKQAHPDDADCGRDVGSDHWCRREIGHTGGCATWED